MSRERDPGRLSEAAPESPLGQLLASAASNLPSDEQLAKLAARLGGVLEPAPVPAAVAPGSSLVAKLGVSLGAAALVVAGLWALRRPHPAALAPSMRSVPSAAAPSVAADTTRAPVALALSGSATASAAKPALSPAPSAANIQKRAGMPVKSVGAEGPSEPVLLEQARRALTSSPAAALALTNQHAARFPRGVLAQEREVIAIEALRRLGRGAEADRRAAAFSQAFPGSAHQRMVEDSSPK